MTNDNNHKMYRVIKLRKYIVKIILRFSKSIEKTRAFQL